MATESIASLNAGQRVAHDTSLESVLASRVSSMQPQGRLFLVHGSGGVAELSLNTLDHLAEADPLLCSVWHLRECSLFIVGGRTTQ